MGLLDRINDDRDRRLLDQSQESLREEREKAAINDARSIIIADCLSGLAQKLDVEMAPLPGLLKGTATYQLGDIVMAVRLFETANQDELNSTERSLVVVQHYASVVGLDRRTMASDRLRPGYELVRIGQLSWLDYAGLYEAIGQAPSYLEFRRDEVVTALQM